MTSHPDPVECYSGSDYAGRPLAVHWQGERLEVEEVLMSWRGPQGKGYRVQTIGGQFFDLFYDLHEDTWRITALNG